MAHGGKRNGAGRKKGGKSKKTLEREAVIEADRLQKGPTAVQVMRYVMHSRLEAGDLDGAVEIAKDLAPYESPKLASVVLKGDADQPIRLVEEFVVVDANPHPQAENPPGPTPVPS